MMSGAGSQIMPYPIDQIEITTAIDLALIQCDSLQELHSLPLDFDRTLGILSPVSAVGFPLAMDGEFVTIVPRGFAGHVVTRRQLFQLPGHPPGYEVSFFAPPGLSGAPLVSTFYGPPPLLRVRGAAEHVWYWRRDDACWNRRRYRCAAQRAEPHAWSSSGGDLWESTDRTTATVSTRLGVSPRSVSAAFSTGAASAAGSAGEANNGGGATAIVDKTREPATSARTRLGPSAMALSNKRRRRVLPCRRFCLRNRCFRTPTWEAGLNEAHAFATAPAVYTSKKINRRLP